MDVVTKLTLKGHSNYEQLASEVEVFVANKSELEQMLQADLEMDISIDDINDIVLLEEGLRFSDGRQQHTLPDWELDNDFDEMVAKIKSGTFKLMLPTLYATNKPAVAYHLVISEVPNEGQPLISGQHILKPGYVWFAY